VNRSGAMNKIPSAAITFPDHAVNMLLYYAALIYSSPPLEHSIVALIGRRITLREHQLTTPGLLGKSTKQHKHMAPSVSWMIRTNTFLHLVAPSFARIARIFVSMGHSIKLLLYAKGAF